MKLLQILFLFLSIISFAQENEIDIIKEDYKKVRNFYEDYRDETDLPNKYFHFHLKNSKENYFIYLNKKKYDSLIVLKLPDSVIINKSIFFIKINGQYKYTVSDFGSQDIYNFSKYLKDKLTSKEMLDIKINYYNKTDYNHFTFQAYYSGEEKYPFLYQYQKFTSYPFNPSTNMVYEKIYLQDGAVKIYDYKTDFPLSDEEFLKKVPKIFAEQSVELLKDGKKIKNFNKNTAKNVSLHMLGAIIKAGDEYKYDYKYELKKGYSENDPSKPVYSFIFYRPADQFWGLTIEPKTDTLINVDYGQGVVY